MDQLESHIKDWREMAAVDPLRAVLVRSRRWDVDEFFATAQPHADQLFSAVSALGVPTGFDRALDFGCGAGRLLPHFEKRFQEVWGVDVSQDMINLASRYNPGCKFYLNSATDLRFFPSNQFDLVHSLLVLQHLPNEAMIVGYIKEFMRILRPGGLAAFQVPDRLSIRWRIQPRRRIYHLLRALGMGAKRLQSWNLLPMKLTAASENTIRAAVSGEGGTILRTERLGGIEGLMYYSTK